MSKKKENYLNRRMFLKGAGGFTLAIPLLPSLLPRSAWAQVQNTGIKRYFSFALNYDYGHHQNWFPTLNQLPNIGMAGTDQTFRYQALRSFLSTPTSILSPALGRGLNPYLHKANLFRGLNLHSRIAHGWGHLLGNIANTDGHDPTVTGLKRLPTIDQVLAANRNFTPRSNDPLIIGSHPYSAMRDQNGQVVRASGSYHKPHQFFDSLFTSGGNPLPESGGATQAHPRRDALSRVYDDYTRIRNGRNISSEDVQVLNNAMDRFSDILTRIAAGTTTAGCSYSGVNVSQSRTDGLGSLFDYNPETRTYAFDLYARIMAAAASCDLHRVFDFHMIINDGHFDRHPSEDFHQGHSHQPWSVIANNANKVNHQYMGEIVRSYVDAFLVPLVTALDSINESNGKTALDNSLVHMTMESSTLHNDNNKPCLMIGSADGALTTGHYIDYSNRALGPHQRQGDLFVGNANDPQFGHDYYGIHYNRSLVTILQAMGLQPQDYEDPEINAFFQNRTDGILGVHNNNITRVGGYGHIGSNQNPGWPYSNNQQFFNAEYARMNHHHYKDPMPLPPTDSE